MRGAKSLLVRLMGAERYLHWVETPSALYHSLFRSHDLRERGIHLVAELIPRGGVVLDIGAHIGKFTARAAGLVGRAGHVYAFEPVEWSRGIMSRMVRLRGLRQVHIVPCGLSDRAGPARIRIPQRLGGRPNFMLAHVSDPSTGGDEAGEETIALDTLDGFCERHPMERIDFIKCDAEGHEARIFAGAAQTLARFHPILYCEVEEDYSKRGGASAGQVFAMLEGHGYRAFLADASTGRLTSVDGFRVNSDYFFIHAEARWLRDHPVAAAAK